MKETTNSVVKVMLEKYQTDISMFDETFLAKTLESRITEISVKTYSQYLIYLKENETESVLLKESLNNSFSEFFRNPLTFIMIEQLVLPKIFNRKVNDQSGEIRIWSAGCAAGQEPYSIAILAEDYRVVNHLNVKFRIFGTDISRKELNTASKGIFHLRSLQNTRLYHVEKYFSNSGEFYSINSGIKEIVDFSEFDLLNEGNGAPPSSIYGDFDVVMCSNLLFYYKPEIQKKIISRLSDSLVSGGFLITGEAEIAIIKSFREFKQLAAPAAIFVKN
jgi:chemotaxis methyl-accepting protein methylase